MLWLPHRETQEGLYKNQVDFWLGQGYDQASAEAEAALLVARPDTSEHQLGLAADIVSAGNQILDESQEQTPEQQWLLSHCQEYGFILRYPSGKTELTGVSYEPWHYRYVGVEAAGKIMEQGLCLEEYLEGLSPIRISIEASRLPFLFARTTSACPHILAQGEFSPRSVCKEGLV